VFILAPLDPGGIVIARGDELLRPDGPSIEAQRAEARRAKGGGEVLGKRQPTPPHQLEGLGERCKLPQRSLRRSQERIYRGGDLPPRKVGRNIKTRAILLF